jgi:hypothetical protein
MKLVEAIKYYQKTPGVSPDMNTKVKLKTSINKNRGHKPVGIYETALLSASMASLLIIQVSVLRQPFEILS